MTVWGESLVSNQRVPRYIALADAIESAIQSGKLKQGERLPTHRNLADLLSVTVGTVTRGYAEAERRGLVNAIVGSGTFVGSPESSGLTFNDLTQKPDTTIDFSLNLPVANRMSPVLRDILPGIAANHAIHTEILEYQSEQGLIRHRQWASEWLQQFGVTADVQNLTVTCGAQHAITLALQATTRPGDVVAAEGLSYPGINAVASQLGIKVLGIPIDDQGISVDNFEKLCRQNNIRSLYCCPTLHNPTNASMGLERRQAIVKVAEKHNVWLIEDEVPAVFHQQPVTALYQLAPDRTLYINSHSKLVAPGLRVGYLVSPANLTDAVAAALRAQCWFGPTLSTEVAQKWLDSDAANRWHLWQKQELDQRIEIAQQVLHNYGIQCRAGSFHAWLPLPESWRASDFKERLISQGVKVLTAESFAVGRFTAPQAVRICLSAPDTVEMVRTGLEIIQRELERPFDKKVSVF